MIRTLPIAYLSVALGLLAPAAMAAEPPPMTWFPVQATALYRTGDSWSDAGTTYRLYGVQACLRGTMMTNAHGLKRDCGEASLAMLVALVRDLHPQCTAAARLPQDGTVLVFCVATRTTGAGAGSRIDLGTALIATGFAFAALTPDGAALYAPYGAAEDVARRSHAGLWAFPDLPLPGAIILRALASPPSSLGSPTP